MDQLESFLGDPSAIERAREAEKTVQGKLPKVDQAIGKVEGCLGVQDGDKVPTLSQGVKSQMAVSKLKESCQDMEKRLSKLIPTSSAEINQCGYSKWGLAAVLIRDGFVIYADMMHHQSVLPVLVLVLEQAKVDRQIIDAIQYYLKRIRACISVLEDLGLMKVLQKTQEFIPDNKERSNSKLAEMNIDVSDHLVAATLDNKGGETTKLNISTREVKEQTINVTTDTDPNRAIMLAKKRAERQALKRAKSMDGSNDPPRTEKPKGKMVLPGSRSSGRPGANSAGTRGRGVGRSLSKEEAKEVTARNPYDKKRQLPKRSQTMPSLPSQSEQQEKPAPRRGKKPAATKQQAPPTGKDTAEDEPPQDSQESKSEEEAKENDDKKSEKSAGPKKTAKQPPKRKTMPARTESGESQNGVTSELQAKRKSQLDRLKKQREKSRSRSPTAGKRPSAPAKLASAAGKENPATVQDESNEDDTKVAITIVYNGIKRPLQVDLTNENIGGLKKRLQERTKLEVENQKLSSKDGEYKNNEKTLAACGIQKGSELFLDFRSIDVQFKIMPQDGKVIDLTVESTTTLKVIKQQIGELTGLEVAKLELYYKKEELIERNKTVKQMGLQEGSKVVVEADMAVGITVSTMDKKTIQLEVNPCNDVLKDLKKALEKLTGEPASNQKLFSMPENLEFVEKKDKTFLRDYGIQEDSELYMEPKVIEISVELPDGTSSELKVAPSSDMTQIIEAFVRTGTAAKKAKLKFQGKEFPKGKTVKDMGLLEGSLVKLEMEA